MRSIEPRTRSPKELDAYARFKVLRLPQGERRVNPRRLLTRDEEVVLCQIVQGNRPGDPKWALAELTRRNMGLLSKLAGRHCRGEEFPFEDALTEAYIGFHTAVLKFDEARGTKLATSATHWITQSLMRARDDKSRTIRLPNHVSEMVRKYHARLSVLEDELGRPATMEEKVVHLKLPKQRIQAIEAVPQSLLSLDCPIPGKVPGEDDSRLGDFIADPLSFDEDKFVEAVDLKQVAQACLSHLCPRDADVLMMRFGFPPYDQVHSLEVIAHKYDLTRERVRQIEAKALKRVREALGMDKNLPTEEEIEAEAENPNPRPRTLDELRARNDAVLAALEAGEDEWAVSTRFGVGVQRVRRIATEARKRRRFANGDEG